MTHKLTRSCPLCESNERAVKKFFEDCTVVSCNQCGFLYVADPDETTVSEGDADLSDARHNSVPSPERRHHYILNLVEMMFGEEAQILEIGAGYGPLGKLLQNNGHEYLGFEPSKVRASVAKKEGVNIISDIHDPDQVENMYDAVVLDNVIEHVRRPKQILDDAKPNLKDSGIIITIVPSRYDLRRFYPRWNKTHFWIPNAHINFFRPNDLKRLHEYAGFQMRPFPTRVFGDSEIKDQLFTLKSIVERFGWYPGSLYTFGTLRGNG